MMYMIYVGGEDVWDEIIKVYACTSCTVALQNSADTFVFIPVLTICNDFKT